MRFVASGEMLDASSMPILQFSGSSDFLRDCLPMADNRLSSDNVNSQNQTPIPQLFRRANFPVFLRKRTNRLRMYPFSRTNRLAVRIYGYITTGCTRFYAPAGFPRRFTGTLPPAVPVLMHRPACRADLRVHYPYIPAPECSFLQNVDTCLLRSQQLCVRNRFYRNMFTAYSVRH